MENETNAASQTAMGRIIDGLNDGNSQLESIYSRVKSRIDATIGSEDVPEHMEKEGGYDTLAFNTLKIDILFERQQNLLSRIEAQLDRLDQIL